MKNISISVTALFIFISYYVQLNKWLVRHADGQIMLVDFTPTTSNVPSTITGYGYGSEAPNNITTYPTYLSIDWTTPQYWIIEFIVTDTYGCKKVK